MTDTVGRMVTRKYLCRCKCLDYLVTAITIGYIAAYISDVIPDVQSTESSLTPTPNLLITWTQNINNLQYKT